LPQIHEGEEFKATRDRLGAWKRVASGDEGTIAPSMKPSPSGVLNARRELHDAADLESGSEITLRLVALPVALLLGLLFASSGLGHALQRIFFGMVLHELGHAVSAWLLGFPAFPLLWFTPVAEHRSGLFSLMLLAAGVGLLVAGRRSDRTAWMLGGGALAALVIFGMMLGERQARALITFGGDAGALILGTLFMATLFVGPESRLRRGGLRWGLLVIGAAAFSDVAATWWRARRDFGEIPFGRIEGVGLSDPSVLVEMHGWSERGLVRAYLTVVVVCGLVLAGLWVWRAAWPWWERRR